MKIQHQLQQQQQQQRDEEKERRLSCISNDNDNNGDERNDDDNNKGNSSFVTHWIATTEGVRNLMKTIVVKLAVSAATYPKMYVGTFTTLSLGLLVIGFLTNFNINSDQNSLFAPDNCRPVNHFDWILDQDKSGFHSNHPLFLNIHTNGNNILDISVNEKDKKTIVTDNGVALYDFTTPVPSIVQVLRTAFDTVDVVRNHPEYNELCKLGNYFDPSSNEKTCRTLGATRIWDHDRQRFEKELKFQRAVHNDDYDWLLSKLSADTTPDGIPMFHEAIIGNAVWETDNNDKRIIVSAQALLMVIELPLEPGYEKKLVKFEHTILRELGVVRHNWMDQALEQKSELTAPKMEFFSDESYALELLSAINNDIWLLALVTIIMVAFTCSIFLDGKDKVNSRCLIGLSSILTISMSLACAFGIMFIIGVPFTFITQMIPFVVLGIGLDDTFIITGEYYRQLNTFISNKNRNDDNCHGKKYKNNKIGSDDEIVQMVRLTMEEVGISISLTTITTNLAFFLGVATSSLPSVQWLCLYAVTTISIDFFFQVTLFVALLVLNERRVRDNKCDIFFWIQVEQDGDDDDDGEKTTVNIKNVATTKSSKLTQTYDIVPTPVPIEEDYCPKKNNYNKNDGNDVENSIQEYGVSSTVRKPTTKNQCNEHVQEEYKEEHRHVVERFMSWYADKLLRPRTKMLVLAVFAAFLACCIYSITLFEQAFDITEYFPAGSHIHGFVDSGLEYTTTARTMAVYFRDMDQSDPAVQAQMIDYIEDITTKLKPVGGKPPAFCWFRDIQLLLNGELTTDERFANTPTVLPDIPNVDFLKSMSTNEQIEFVLSNNIMRELYGPDITFTKNNSTGESKITASRCWFIVRDINLKVLDDQVNMLLDQRRITQSQPINIDVGDDGSITEKKEWPMFTFDAMYMPWEAYIIVVDELTFTIIMGVISVCIVTVVMIPNRSAIFIVFPLIVVMYIDFLGVIRYLGMDINGLTYIVVVVSVGVLVDFLLHILMRYYEVQQHNPRMVRDDCVKKALETMGASMIEGGLTTFLAITPLLLSVLAVFRDIFFSFFAMVTVGIFHGIVLLPVVLSVFGPKSAADCTSPSSLSPDVSSSTNAKQQKALNQCKTTKSAQTRKLIY